MAPLVTLVRERPGATVLIVTNAWPRPDNPRFGIFCQRQVASLEAAGVSCDVMFVRGYVSSARAYLSAAWWLLCLNFARQPKYSVVHAYGGEVLVPAALYVRSPRIVTFLGSDLLGAPRADGSLTASARLKSWLMRQGSLLAAGTIVQSEAMQAALPGVAARRSAVIPAGVDRDLFRPIDKGTARAELGWPASVPIALFAADPDVELKRYWLAEAACEAARAGGVPVRLEVARSIAPERMPLCMNGADCLLMTSASEGSPNVVKEALACGLPIVATSVGDVPKLLSDVNLSYICPSTPAALGEALARCLRHPSRSNGRERSAWLGEPAIASRIVAFYDEVTGRRRPAGRR